MRSLLGALLTLAALTGCDTDFWNDAITVPPDPGPTSSPSPTPAAGMLDPTFDGDGRATLDFSSAADTGRALALQSDGRIVIAGYSQLGMNFDMSVVRFNADGSPDTTFSGDGKVTTAIGSGIDMAEAVAIQADGRIVIAGTSSSDFAIVRYSVDGTLDATFDADGKLTLDFGGGGDSATAVAIQADGRIVVAGFASNGSDADFAIVRCNADGTLDASFDGDGKVTVAVGLGDDHARAIAIQPDGKIVVAGLSDGAADDDFAVVRLNADGTLDATFSGDGRQVSDLGANDAATALAIQPDGKIVLAGFSMVGSDLGSTDFAMARYEADGMPDAAFEGDGLLKADISASADELYAVALQADGAIVVAGKVAGGMAAARYTPAGVLDSSFDVDGVASASFAGGSYAMGVAIQSDLKVVVAGTAFTTGNPMYAAARFD